MNKEILNWEVKGRRRRRRDGPRKEWMADVSESIDGNGLKETDSEARTAWKEKIKELFGRGKP